MMMADALHAVQVRLREMKGLRSLLVMEQDQKNEAIELERQAEEDAKRSGFMKVVNEGFWATFGREFQIALMLDSTSEIVPRTNELLHLKDQEGKRIGEWVGGKEARSESRSATTRGDFRLYDGIKIVGEPYFAIPEIKFPFLDGVKGIAKVTSCSPAIQVDENLREWTGIRGEDIHTRIVGFDMDRDDLD